LIYSLRKALTQQKRLETTCDQLRVPIEYRWSINLLEQDSELTRATTRTPARELTREPIRELTIEPINVAIPEPTRELTRELILEADLDSEKSELGGVH
jgi:hypothetical protein